MRFEFVKSHGTANDFVMVEDLDDVITIDAELTAKLCERRRGIGADGLIRIAPGESSVFMDYRNADGTVAEMCGNGIRCLAKYCFDRGILSGDGADIETRDGIKHVTVYNDSHGFVTSVDVDMGSPQLAPADIPVEPPLPPRLPPSSPNVARDDTLMSFSLEVEGSTFEVAAVGMGNPHAVIRVDDVDQVPVALLGPQIESHRYFPQNANVEFVTIRDSTSIDMRVWERGSTETMACGTGACAGVVVATELGLIDGEADVRLPGGVLHVVYGDSVMLRGPAVEVFEGVIDTRRL